ncbi:PPOX class F420-dependent oxidoreductase [Nitriliruptor alkaliphilus]|uniref:PPOX class F420-dependent oxidoreductase n=1 Tax=Nitriliruptor alkaliphilus TaxID=427918 RepID=UPI0006968B3D|nr:PPOX class F420-dependent oxidoreductase [Nitriliruptor alkaliphilus]
MSSFDPDERRYLAEARGLARIATVGADGSPHVVPSGWSYDEDLDALVLGGRQLERTKKFRDVRATGRAAVVIDDVVPPWQPRGVEVRGRAEAIVGPPAVIRVHPDRVVSWGLDATA